jgi:chaperonin GroEL
LDFSAFTLADFGRCKAVEIGKSQTAIIGGKGSAQSIDERTEQLRELIKETDELEECKRIQERITRLASGVVTIRVGGSSEVEVIEKKHRIEDALEAVRSAQLSGTHPGGGVTLLRASRTIKAPKLPQDQIDGYNFVIRSLSAPFEKICENLDLQPEILAERVVKSKDGCGLDVKTMKVVDLYEAGIIDPVRVTTSAVKNSVSVVSTLITTNNAIVEV